MIFGIAAASASIVHSQEVSPLEPPDTERFLRWGPLRVRPNFTIPNLGYDSNVFYRPEESGLPRVGDYFVALAPGVQGMVLFGHRAFLTFEEKLEFYAYAHETELNYFNQFGKARLTVPFHRLGLYGDFGYNRVQDRPIDRQDARPIRKETPLGAGIILQFGWRTDGELGQVRTTYTAEDENDPTIGPRLDRVETGNRLRLRYLIFGRTRLTLDGLRRTIRFDDPVTASQRNGNEGRALLGLDFGLGGRVYGTVRAGTSKFDLDDPTATEYHGLVADAALGYSFGDSGSWLALNGQRDIRYTVYELTNLYTYSGLNLTLVKYFNRFIGMELGAGREYLNFLGDPQSREDNDTNGTIGIRFKISENDLGRRVEYAFRYTRWIINSTRDDLDQNRGTIGFGVTVGY